MSFKQKVFDLRLFIDLETFCETPITHGTHKYAESAEILLVAIAVDDFPVDVWDLANKLSGDFFASYAEKIDCLQGMIDAADEVVIHNSAFDRTILWHNGITIPPEKITDTLVLALEHSLPASLGQLCEVLGVEADKAKDKAGKKLINLFCKPRSKNMKLRRASRDTHPEEWEQFVEYARLDVVSMRDILGKLPRWNDTAAERDLWLLDQSVNDRGVAIDIELARSAIRAFSRAMGSLGAATERLTGGSIGSTTQRQKLLDHLAEAHDYTPADMTKGTVAAELKRDDLASDVRDLLKIRQQAAATSPAKYKVLLNATSSDGRLRGTIQFCGASRTGRDAGRIFQPQNLPRPTLKPHVIEQGIDAMKNDCEDLIFENVSELCASAVRGCIVAEAGKKLVVSDLSNIEGRVAAWIAGEAWKVLAFKDFDAGVGPDLYVLAYSKAFNVAVSEVTKADRQKGKVMELSMGFQGGPAAFNRMGANYGLVVPEEEAVVLVKAWRKTHPAIVRMWYNIQDAAKAAINNPHQGFEVGPLHFDMRDGWLRIKVPGGNYLSYPDARIDPDSGQILYSGTNQYTRKWETLETYGGKFFENIVQKVARNVFKHGTKLAVAAGYKLVIPVHDENVTEVPDTEEYTADGLSALMCIKAPWMLGLPLAAAGHEMRRYQKMD